MAQTYRQQFIAVMKANERDMTALFQRLADQIRGTLLGAANADGVIPQARGQEVRESARAAVTAVFLSRGRGGDLVPYEVISGVVIPTTPYMRVLWRHIEGAMTVSVQRHADMMTRKLEKAPAVLARMKMARGNAFITAKRMQVKEQTGAVWRPNPFAEYDAPHTWIDERGYRLSDRIWRTDIEVRRRIDLLIDEGIREGRSALAIANDLEDLLLPGRKLIRTDKPYGTDASFDAMRLARTEITRANAQADLTAANMNPFVESFDWVLSGSHPKADICDELAEGGPYPKSGSAQIPPAHPFCLCYMRWVVVENAGLIIADLREQVRRERAALMDLIGPLLVEEFTRHLMRQFEVFAPSEPVPFP